MFAAYFPARGADEVAEFRLFSPDADRDVAAVRPFVPAGPIRDRLLDEHFELFADVTVVKLGRQPAFDFGEAVATGLADFRRNLIRMMLSEQMALPEPVWRGVNWSWVGFFVFMGAANLYVAYNYNTDVWVNFKLFGGMGLMVLFVVVQSVFLAKYVEESPGDASGDKRP